MSREYTCRKIGIRDGEVGMVHGRVQKGRKQMQESGVRVSRSQEDNSRIEDKAGHGEGGKGRIGQEKRLQW